MRAVRLFSLIPVLACLLVIVNPAQAQNPINWSVKANANRAVKPGEKVSVQLTAQIAPG